MRAWGEGLPCPRIYRRRDFSSPRAPRWSRHNNRHGATVGVEVTVFASKGRKYSIWIALQVERQGQCARRPTCCGAGAFSNRMNMMHLMNVMYVQGWLKNEPSPSHECQLRRLGFGPHRPVHYAHPSGFRRSISARSSFTNISAILADFHTGLPFRSNTAFAD